MRFHKQNKLYLPAVLILTVVLILLIFIGVSTYRNLDRDKRKTLRAFHRQGLSLLHAIETGAQMTTGSLKGRGGLDDFFREATQNDAISYIYLLDENGIARHHSPPESLDRFTPWPLNIRQKGKIVTRVQMVSENRHVYEIAGLFLKTTQVIVIGLHMSEFETSHTADFHHALIMLAILVVLGLAAIFFGFVIQNYYLINKTLKQTQDYTRQVVANMANGLLSINMNGEVVSFNLLALDLLGLKNENIEGLDLRSVFNFDITGISKTLTECRLVMDHEIHYQLPGGQTIPLSLSVTPIAADNNSCSGAVIVLRDLREIKRLEAKVRRSEKLAAVGELAAGVAHEIRNPLSAIKGFAQFLRHALKDHPEEQEYAAVMVKEIDRINRVVTDLLTYARPVVNEKSPVDLPELIAHTVQLVSADAQAKHVAITPIVADGLERTTLDDSQIMQALLNLLLNSLQAIASGGKIEIGARRMGGADNRLHIWVEDNGPGISRQHQAQVLKPFFTTRGKGTGLGLAIVHKIVENHLGEIKIQSPLPGEKMGTRVSLYLPPAEEI